MRRQFIGLMAAALLATGANAQGSQPAAQHDSHNPAIKDSKPKKNAGAARGANSFTEDQARGRLTKAGYTGVSKLTKTEQGQWQGTAMRAGKSVRVALDYKGNITTR